MRILITGASGFIGTSFLEAYGREGNEVLGTYFKHAAPNLKFLDVRDTESVKDLVKTFSPELIVHCAAMGRPDECERDPELANDVNVTGTKNIVEAARDINAAVAFLSSIYVFDGEKGSPYNESDKPSPLSVYGKTKVQAEESVLTLTHNIVLRTDMVYGYNGEGKRNGLVGVITNSQEPLFLDDSSLRQPTFLGDIPQALTKIIDDEAYGTYHLGGKERLTQLDLARKIESHVRESSSIHARTAESNLVTAPRPKDLVIDTSKARGLGIGFTDVEGAVGIIGEGLLKGSGMEGNTNNGVER